MAQTPVWEDYQFVSASALNAAAAQVAASIEDVGTSLFNPGIVNSAAITFSEASLVVTVTFGSTARVLFDNGTLAGGYGNTADASSGVYSVNMASLVPGSGSQTAFIVATASQVAQQAVTITGPTAGHPDFDPTFVPYAANLEELDTVTLTATLTPANNTTTFEVARMTLTSGSSTITNFSNGFQYFATAVQAPTGSQSYGAPGTYTFTVPAGVTLLREVIVTGAGGGASNSNSTTPNSDSTQFSGGGGGAGGTAIKRNIAVSPGQTFSVTVGTGGEPQSDGGTSSFGAVTATGGAGAFFVGFVSGGAPPGSGSGGDINISGGYGSDGQDGSLDFPGNGGASYWGGGGRAAAGGSQGEQNGQAPGSGGGGSYNGLLTDTSGHGGSGEAGIVSITW